MTAAAQAPSQPTKTGTPANAGAPDLARTLLERQLWVLGQLAEGGLEIARAIEHRATSDDSEDAVLDAAPIAYARVARAVRMTLMLQSKLIADLQALEAKAAHEAAHANCLRGTQRVGLKFDQKERIGRIISRIAEADGADEDEVERLAEEAAERLDQDDLYGDILTRPVSEIIALICQDLGLAPNWPKLAEEAWAKAEIESGAAGSPLAGLMTQSSRPLPLAGEGVSPDDGQRFGHRANARSELRAGEAVERACAWQTASAEPSMQPNAPSGASRQPPRQRGSSP